MIVEGFCGWKLSSVNLYVYCVLLTAGSTADAKAW
jgi:hypothetical protein